MVHGWRELFRGLRHSARCTAAIAPTPASFPSGVQDLAPLNVLLRRVAGLPRHRL